MKATIKREARTTGAEEYKIDQKYSLGLYLPKQT